MKNKNIIGITFAAILLVGCATESKEAKQAKLQAEAKISQTDAQATALAQTPGGTVKEAEIEKEHGKLIWSFDIATAGSPNITEVAVDAINGKVVSVEKETPKDQEKEAAEDKKAKDKD